MGPGRKSAPSGAFPKRIMIQNIDIDLELAPILPGPPFTPKDLSGKAASNDEITIQSWKDIWVRHYSENHLAFGPFKYRSIGGLYQSQYLKPAIVVGSGPSLSKNVANLKDTKGIPIISCLHNFHYLEDNDVSPNYYVTLDSGEVTLEEIAEGGKKPLSEYLELSKKRTLIAYVGTHPKLLESWKGKVFFYNAPIPSSEIIEEQEKVERFRTYISTGGNVLGASFYFAKAILGANPIIFTGADLAFSYTKKFHAWDSKYDKAEIGHHNALRVRDIFGMPVWTYPSYYNFKYWFDAKVTSVPGIYINATEGGTLGAYDNGVIRQFQYMSLQEAIQMYALSSELAEQCLNPETEEKKILF